MQRSDRTKRWVALYIAVALYCVLLPIVLSYALGYNIDYGSLKIYKTGIMYLKSQPAGAIVSINGRQLSDLTPARIEELKPGTYSVEVRREGFYPWQKELIIRPNMVTKAEEIVLFPISRDINKICDSDVLDFDISDKGRIYYMTKAGLFGSGIDGTSLKELTSYSDWPAVIKGRLFSPDGNKMLFYNDSHIWVIYLKREKSAEGEETAKVEEAIKSESGITNVFWYSQSNYIIFVSGKEINALELSGQGARNIATLYKFSAEPKNVYYDPNNDSLYFTDLSHIPGKGDKSCLYRLDLRQKFVDQLMQRFKLKKDPDIKYEKR